MNLDKLRSALQRVGTTRNRRAHGARKPRRATSQPRLEHLEGRVLFSVQPVGVTFAPIELLAFSGTVATFTSNDPTPQSASNYSAAIVWGDGTTTAGTVAANEYLILGILLILVGFIFTLSSVKIPKIRVR